jgi:hypothetical protein
MPIGPPRGARPSYRRGQHGFGMIKQGAPGRIELFGDWLRDLGLG